MNEKLKFVFKSASESASGYAQLIIGIEGQNFTQLGLPPGNLDLTPVGKEWFEKHGDEVVAACERCKVTEPWLPGEPKYRQNPEYRTAQRAKWRLLDKFCKKCKIKDS